MKPFVYILAFSLCVTTTAAEKRPRSSFCASLLARITSRHVNVLPNWFFTHKIPRPTGFARVNKAALKRWVEAQDPRLHPVAQFIADHLTIVSQEQFEAALYASFQKFLDARKTKKPILIVLDSKPEVDSMVWVAALLREKFPDAFADARFVIPGQTMNYLTKDDADAMKSGEYDIIYADDASYSATSIPGKVQNRLRVPMNWDGEGGLRLTGPSDPLIHVICPFTTAPAAKRIGELKQVALYSTQTMPTIGEMIAALPHEQQESILPFITEDGPFPGHKTLTGFDHKFPDSFSVPSGVIEGNVFGFTDSRHVIETYQATQKNEDPKPITVPFIRIGSEPYKR